MLRRKAIEYLETWKGTVGHKPLIVSGARQIGKTMAIRMFAKKNYKNVIEINFSLQKKFRNIFDDGFEVDVILKNISLKEPMWKFVPGDTLIFFDEFQDCPNCATSLKSFHFDGRYDVVCSGSLMGIHYKEIDSNSVGFKEDYQMYALDFEEFLWAKGYSDEQIEDIAKKATSLTPFSETEMNVFTALFREYMVVGGMPEVVNTFVENGNYSGILKMQRQLLKDYEDDIVKYARDIGKAKIKAFYEHIPVFLGKGNKKFQISKVAHGARSREYVGVKEWLSDAKVVNVCHCLELPELPLGGNYLPDNYKMYYHDNGLLIASLDEEAQEDLRVNRNFGTYKGAIYENIIAETLVKQGYKLFFYRNEKSTIEMDFFIRNADSLIPVEVKATDGATASLNNLTDKDRYEDIKYGIKLCEKNVGFNGKFYTLPYFCVFLLKKIVKNLK